MEQTETTTEIKKKVLKNTYTLEDNIIKEIKIDKNLVLRVIENANGTFIDIRKFYKDYPTKKGIRFTYGTFLKLHSLINN